MIEALSEVDLNQINQFTQKEYSAENIYAFKVKAIDDAPTANNRVWSVGWQRNAVEKNLFNGIPVVVNHENDQALVLGRVFHAEQVDNAIYAKAFVPLDTPTGKQAKANIDAGLYRSVSINASAENKKEKDGLLYVYPSPNDRLFELSFVAIAGCRDCTTQKETIPDKAACDCRESKESIAEKTKDNDLRELADITLAELRAEYIKLQAALLGTGINRVVYTQLAETIPPLTLRACVKDLRVAASKKSTITLSPKTDGGEYIERSLEALKTLKGF